MSKHRSGGKFTDAHSSFIPAAEKLVDLANGCPEVTKIVLGHIKVGIGGGQHRLKITLINGGLRALVRGPTSIQELYIYTKDPERTQKLLEEFFRP